MIVRRDHFAGRPRPDLAGSWGSITAHSASVKSLEYRRPLRACFVRVVSVHMCHSVDASQHRLNHKPLISPNFFSGQTLKEWARDSGAASTSSPCLTASTSRPSHLGWEAHQDGFDVTAGFQ